METSDMKRHIAYLKYVLRHKWFVFLAGLKTGAPLWRLIIHDWTKFLPSEWIPYARTFYAPDGSKQCLESLEFNVAWLKHIHRNSHHWQHWVLLRDNPDKRYLIQDDGEWNGNTRIHDSETGIEARIPDSDLRAAKPISDLMIRELIRKAERGLALPMPLPLIREMVADWAGAGRAITGRWEVEAWYNSSKHRMELHPHTRTQVESLLERWSFE